MELSKRTIRGLENVQNTSLVNDETFAQLLDIVCIDIVMRNGATKILDLKNMHASKPDVVKCAYADITGLFVEAARHKLDAENLSTFLHSVKIFGPRAEQLCEHYAKHRETIVDQLGQIGDGLPCVVDVDWRLDYCVKSSTNNSIGECLYHVCLATKKHAKLERVLFTCTTHQLQDLVYKLKEAARHVDKIANS